MWIESDGCVPLSVLVPYFVPFSRSLEWWLTCAGLCVMLVIGWSVVVGLKLFSGHQLLAFVEDAYVKVGLWQPEFN